MLAVRKTEPAFGLHLLEVDEPPPPGPGEVLIRVAAAGICGSDIHAYEWTPGYEFMTGRMPVTLGHEFFGEVVAQGPGVSDVALGDRVAVWPLIGCERCPACREGRRLDCPNRVAIGLHLNGAFAPLVLAPADTCFRLPKDLDPAVGALAEPLCVSKNAVDIAEIEPGSLAVVLGPGPIGLGIAWFAQRAGARTILVGFNDDLRLATARRMGIEHTADLRDGTLPELVRGITDRLVDCVFEASGAAESVRDGLALVRSSGTVCVVGIHSRPLTINLTDFVRGKRQMRAAHDSPRHSWDEIVDILPRHRGELAHMISHRLPLGEFKRGFDTARQKQAVKVILDPQA